jgi:hypothetical protein
MISQETPESFRSAHQNGKETVTMTRLRDFLFMAPVDILANQEYSWTWDDPDERARLDEAKEIAGECGESWSAFRARVAELRPF